MFSVVRIPATSVGLSVGVFKGSFNSLFCVLLSAFCSIFPLICMCWSVCWFVCLSVGTPSFPVEMVVFGLFRLYKGCLRGSFKFCVGFMCWIVGVFMSVCWDFS